MKDLEVVYANNKFENDHSPISGKKNHRHVNPQGDSIPPKTISSTSGLFQGRTGGTSGMYGTRKR